MSARIFNVLIGLWLFMSVFMWPHTPPEEANTAICGMGAMGLALLSMVIDPARYVSAALGAWVFLSTFLLPNLSRATLWNNAIMGIALFAAALVGRGAAELRREREAFGRT